MESGRITAVTRRLISALLSLLMLVNLAAWPSAALAEVLEHEREGGQFDAQSLPVEPAPVHCPHGCLGHYGQHFQWQVPVVTMEAPVRSTARSIASLPDTPHPQNIPSLPFRPPLDALIRS